MNTSSRYKFIINVAYYALIAGIIYVFVKFLFAYLFPFIIGIVITALVQRPANYLSSKLRIRKGYCALILVIIVFVLLIGVLSFLLFEVGNYIYSLARGDSLLFEKVSEYIESIISQFKSLPEFLVSLIRNMLNGLAGIITDFAKEIVKKLPMFLTSTLITIIASCYIAKDYDRFKASVLSVTSDKYKLAAREIKNLFSVNLKSLFVGYLKIMFVTFGVLAVGLVFLKTKNAFIYAGLIALLDILPVFGTGTVLIPWSLYSFIVSDYYFGAGIIILYTIIMIVRNVIEPKIIGKQIGLHPLIALIAVFIGLKLFGFLGIFILPFLTMLVYQMYERGVFEILFGRNNETP